jgi:hypothetical protein
MDSNQEAVKQAGTKSPDHQTVSGEKIEMSSNNFGNKTIRSGPLIRSAVTFY